MTKNEDHFEEFQPHTKVKHAILDAYIVAWAMKLLMWGKAGDRLAVVDAFAGMGRDRSGNDGSPVVAARRASEAMAAAKGTKPWLSDPRVCLIALEKKPSHYKALVEVMKPYVRERPGLIDVRLGELADHIDEIVRITDGAPTFYFLDPYGIKGLDATTYPRALAGRHNEIFALFADIGATRLHGLVTAGRRDATDAVEQILAQPSLFPDEDSARIAAAEADAARVNEALDASIPASRAHLSRALGSEAWVTELERTPPVDRPDAFLRLFRRALLDAGAQFVVTIPMRNDAGHRVYSLVHASKSAVGFITMKEAVRKGLSNGGLSDEARRRIEADLSLDLGAIIAVLRQGLAGRQHPWADQGPVAGINSLVMRHSAMFPFQSGDLKRMLREGGVLQRIEGKETCVFPGHVKL